MARIGGDEFAVLTPCTHAVAAGRLAEAIRATLQAAAEGAARANPCRPPPSASRCSRTTRATATTSSTPPIRRCSGPRPRAAGNYRFFEASMGRDVRERRLLEKQLRHALAEDQLRLVYQPQIETRSRAVIGFEALLRWHLPERGLRLAGRLHPHRGGERADPGDRRMGAAGGLPGGRGLDVPLSVAVNVSAVQIHEPGFAPAVHAILVRDRPRPGAPRDSRSPRRP